MKRKQEEAEEEEGKRQKRYSSSCSSHNNNSCSLVDRLPDDILVHILSLMPTRDCVRSSTLGKRWRHLWARVPNLNLDRWDHKTLRSFSNFFNRFVFTHKGHNINSLRIAYEDDDDNDMECSEYISEIETLIGTAIACNVQAIQIHPSHKLVLPQCLFTCKTVVVLRLNGIRVKNVPMDGTRVYLPALKKLNLVWVYFESEESFQNLISGCPALEELTILNEVHLHISSPTLTRLTLEKDYDYGGKGCEVKLDTPALKYLRLHVSSFKNFSTGMLASLIEADVVFGAQTDSGVRSILEFVSKLNNVSFLKLTNFCMKVPDSSLTTTQFPNLTKLQLVGSWLSLKTFLEIADNLQVLTMDMLPVDKHQYWMEPKQVPVCLIYHLRTVSFCNFKCSGPELNMVKYVLKNAKVLTTMKIRVTCYRGLDLKGKKEALERITLFERASEACQFAFKYKLK